MLFSIIQQRNLSPMDQMKACGLETVWINFADCSLPESVRKLRPMVWHDETLFCVLLGPDPQSGVFGCGLTVAEALADWDSRVMKHLQNAGEDDEVALYIKESMSSSVYKIN